MKPRFILSFLYLVLLILNSACQPQDTQLNIQQLDDAKRARIGVMTGSTGESITKNRFPEATVKSFDDVMDAIAALKSGQLDAIVTGYPSAVQTAKKNPELSVLKQALDHEDTAIAVRKDNPALLAELDQLISRLQRDGTLADMKRRWLKTDLSPYESPEIELPKQGPPLRIGVSATREPFSFVDKSGHVSGHDGELARRIGAALHRPVVFSDMKFMALIPALQSGKVDLIVTGMTATEERKQFVNFTQPYFANAQVMMVKIQGKTPKAESTSINRLEDLDQKRIAVLSGSAGDLAARQYFAHAQFQAMEAATDAALAVKTQKSDAFVYDKSVLLNLVAKNPQLRILEQPLTQLEVAAAIKLDNPGMLQAINHALQTLNDNGRLQQLRQKWLTPYSGTPPALALPSPGTTSQAVLRLGTSATLEPFSFLANGHLTGLDIELGYWIAHLMDKRLEIVDMQFEALIPALQAGKIDFALSNFNVTAERQQLVAFSVPYSQNDIAALVRQVDNETTALPDIQSLADKRLGVLLGSAHDRYAGTHFPKATLLQYQAPADVALAVKTGKVDAALFDAEPLAEIMHDDPSFAIIGEPLFWSDVAMGFNQHNSGLKQQFDRFLSQIRSNGVYDDMVNRWMRERLLQAPPLPANPATEILNVGTSNTGFPFTLVKDNQLIGFDIELAQRFAASLGKQAKFSNMEFGSLIAAVGSGKIDMIASSLYITDERKQQIAFSEPYYQMATRMFVLKPGIATAASEPATDNGLHMAWASVVNSFNSNILQENRYLLLWEGLKTTVLISICATLLGTLLGALICLMRLSTHPLLHWPARIYITLIRGTPVLVLLMLTFYVVFASVNIDPVLVAVLAFAMNFAAYVSEIFRTGIESIDKGQVEAGIAMGFSRLKTFIHIELPQTLQRILPVYKGEFISLVKMTSIVGYIAVQDLTKASDIIRSRTFDAFFPLIMVATLYFLISWTLMQSLEYLERVTDPKYRRQQRSKQS